MTRRTAERKEHPLSMRFPEADIAIIDRAARLQHRSRTDFVREAAVRAAEEALMQTALIRLNPASFNAFMKALAGPPVSVPELEQILERAAPWENSGEPQAR
ncbi:MAG: DUF1778 domain-containing protein [Nitrococcus sp.]|nr:DUF1778 domain-containing protein [Nitrococcus sp.]